MDYQNKELESKVKQNLNEVNRALEDEKNCRIDYDRKSDDKLGDNNHRISEATRRRLLTKQIKILGEHLKTSISGQDNPKLMQRAKQASLEAIQRQTEGSKS